MIHSNVKKIGRLFAVALGLGLLFGLSSLSARAANPAPVQTYFITEPEDDVLDAMNVINNNANSPMISKGSIAIRFDGTYVYYDHWEDGFANDIANPTAGEIYANPGNLDGVQIWGNSTAADGCAPQIGSTPVVCTNANDVLNAGDVIILDDSVIDVPNLTSSIDWDGKDKIGASAVIAVSRSLWASGSGSLFAWANAMFPTSDWGQEYTSPVGCNTTANNMFEYTGFSITAAYDDTVIEVDPAGNGTWEAQVTLDEGETYYDGSSSGFGCNYIRQGGKVRSTDPAKPIQVVILTGDIGSNYASRDLNLYPDASLSSSYYIPVGNSSGSTGDPGDVRLFIYNPSSTDLYVRCESPSAANTYTITAGAVNSSFTLENDEAGHCYAVTAAGGTTPDPSRTFSGLATVDTYSTAWDWALPFIPENLLSNQALVGLGEGRDWTNTTTNLTQNGSPLWVTPVCQTFFYVDWNNDGTADKVDFNGDNDVTDTNVDGLDETTSDDGFQVNALQSVRLRDASDRNQTGAYIYTRTAANGGGTGGCSFAGAWGEDPRIASVGSPGMDMGTIIVNLKAVETSKASTLLIDNDNNGVVSPGDTIQYLISIKNIGLSPSAISVLDDIPTHTSYVLNTTEKDVGGGWVSIPDDGSGTPFPLDNPLPDGVSLGNLPVGATWKVRFDVTVDNIPAGQTVQLQNCARIAYDNKNTTTCVTEDVFVPPVPALSLDKTTTTTSYDSVGDVINYSYVVTNSGNVPLYPTYSVADDKATVTCPQTPNPLNMGASITCTATHVVTQADLDAGSVTNVAKATAMDAPTGGNPVDSPTDTVTVPADQNPALTLDKSTTTVNYDSVGDTISYSYVATNSGNVTLYPPYSVADDKIVAPNTVTCNQTPAPLAPGASFTCTATYTVTQADINNGSVTNIAQATAKDAPTGGADVDSPTDTVTVPADQNPGLSLDKTTTTTDYDTVGDVINYSYKVTNSGNVPLYPTYSVADDKATVTCPQTPNPLNPGAFITCTASHVITQADLDAGSVTNVAQATAMDAPTGGNPVDSPTDTVTVPADQNPALTLVKSTTTVNYDSVGDTISYSYVATNSGNVTLYPPYSVADDKIVAPNTVTCAQTPDPLAPGASFTCTATYTVTQADINNGSVTNIAQATAKDAPTGGADVDSPTDTVTVPAVQGPGLSLDKTTTTTDYDAVGDVINYSYKVTNSGNVPLTPPYTVTDDKTTVTCPQTPNPLNPGAFITCTATYVVTQADLDAGSVKNIASAGAMYGTTPVTSPPDDVTVPADQNPSLMLDKSTTTVNYDSVGDTISYSYVVTNNGNVTLYPPYAVADNKIVAPNTVTCNQTPDPLAPGASFNCTATYTVTQDDINNGSVTNIAAATARTEPKDGNGNPGGDPVNSNEDTVTVPAVQGPGLSLDKTTTTANYDSVGDVINYSYKVTNSGNVPLTPPYTVTDDKTTVTCPQTPNPLNPGAFITCTATYVVTQADLDAGSVKNIASAGAMYGTTPVESPPDDVTVPADQNPSLLLDKSTTTVNYDSVGDTISYSYVVTNNGNVTLYPPYSVADDKIVAPNTVTCAQTPAPLAPGASFSCTATYTVTQNDINNGSVTNIAAATARTEPKDGNGNPGGDPVNSNEDTVTVPAVQGPGLSLDKTTTTTSYDSVGDVINYSYKVTNSGNVPLTPPYSVTDDKTTVTCPQTPNPLNPGAFITCTATYVVTQADLDAGSVKNIASAGAMYGTTPVTSPPDDVTVPADQNPSLLLDKSTSTASYTNVGDTISYSYLVTNNGNVTLYPPYSVADDKIVAPNTVTCAQTPAPLAPGASFSCTATYTVTQNDINNGSVTNIAKATAMDAPAGGPTTPGPVDSNEDTVTVPYEEPPLVNVCPIDAAANRWTDIIGIGMGSPTKHKTTAKIVIPNSGDVLALYGQLAAKDQGKSNYVRFMYPGKNNFVQVNTITSPAPLSAAVFWYGTELDPAANIRGRWFLQSTGTKKHIPRAMILYPTYQTVEEYVDVFVPLQTADTQVYHDVANGWVPMQQVTINIPAPLAMTTFNVKVAVVDNDKDGRPLFVTATAGGVSQTLTPTNPNRGDQLNILEFTLVDVPPGTSSITLTHESIAPNSNPLFPLGGDSGALVGVTANYLCTVP